MTHFFKICLRTLLLVGLFGLVALNETSAQGCNPDVTPPTAICAEFVQVALDQNGQATINGSQVDQGSFDNCCAVTIDVRRAVDGPCDSDTDPDNWASNVLLCCGDIGAQFTLEMRVTDCNGNSNLCLTQIAVEDKTNPVLQAPADVTVTCENFDPSLLAYGNATATDNCCILGITNTVNYSQFDTVCNKGTITRVFVASDCSGNLSQLGVVSAMQRIYVNYNQNYFVKFPNDIYADSLSSVGYYGEPSFFGEDCELIGVSYSDEVFPSPLQIRLERTWTIINWCTYNPLFSVIDVPNPTPNVVPNHPANLLGPTVSASGTTGPWAPTIVKISPNDPAPTDFSTFWQANANGYRYTQHIIVGDTFFSLLRGRVYQDLNTNCAKDAGEGPLSGWTVNATGDQTGYRYQATSDANGDYLMAVSTADSHVTLGLYSSLNYSPNCTHSHVIPVISGNEVETDLPVGLPAGTNLLTVDLGTAALRRCFNTNYYTVKGCNLGASPVVDAQIELTLDPMLTYIDSDLPAASLGNNRYLFAIGDLQAGKCRNVNVQVEVSCNAELGATHCSSARILPENPLSWTGPEIRLNSYCDGDSVRFEISNVGQGNMSEANSFIVVEDVIMRGMNNYQLSAGSSRLFSVPANGSTWRIETEQVTGHPYAGLLSATREGCGGLNTTGLVNAYSIDEPSPFVDRECRENIGAFDPNDKSAVPTGVGPLHLVKANTDLEYLIRFQNTGTDTAFNIVVLDTLSQYLDATTARPGAASHEYGFQILEGNILRFAFDNIHLPDSNINEATSHGYVKFLIKQKPDLADGTKLLNSAAIYFDFNEPVITNTVLHTIGEHFLEASATLQVQQNLLSISPNPAYDVALFNFEKPINQAVFTLTDVSGKTLRQQQFTGMQYRFERQQLEEGLYFFRIQGANGVMYAGKIILK
ncbi:MAG: T9SS type A sorting domain-containing protein [Saprospiraceae bacterium]|nr:T9SS type A sorting domain-containing protein [Saprospiraceae bacterium]